MSTESSFLVPVLLDLSGKTLLFVGGGKGTALKLRGLLPRSENPQTLAKTPQLIIVAPEISAEVRELAAQWPGAILRQRVFAVYDLDGVDLVWALTNDPACNALVAREAATRHIFASASGQRESGGFTQPAVASGDQLPDGLIVAVSTTGRSPKLAVQWRDRIKEFLCSYP